MSRRLWFGVIVCVPLVAVVLALVLGPKRGKIDTLGYERIKLGLWTVRISPGATFRMGVSGNTPSPRPQAIGSPIRMPSRARFEMASARSPVTADTHQTEGF